MCIRDRNGITPKPAGKRANNSILSFLELSRRLNQDGNSDDFVDIADKLIDHTSKDSDAGLSLDALPELIEKLESKRHTAHIWVSKDGLISIEDKLFNEDDVRHIMYEKRASDPQLTVSLKADLAARMETISNIHNELRKADALKLNYSTKVKTPTQ